MKQEDWRDWEFESLRATLVACVGCQYGEHPEKNIDVIRVARGDYGDTVAQRLNLSPDDVVMDIGSGCGFVGRNIAPRVKKLFCVDLSKTFLQYCRRELSEFDNVECHLIDYADFSVLAGKGVKKAYSTAVWIHFNFYDIYYYLIALNGLLPVGGTVYFDYADPDGIKLGDGASFRAHSAGYRNDRYSISCCLNYNSRKAVQEALTLTGFKFVKWWRTHEDCCSILARKASVVGL
jgi:SAM-dependent methyltransferase